MLTAISLFTGAGGLDLGFEAAGFQTVASVEIDPDARRTIRLNRPEWGLLDEGDIHRLSAPQVLRHARVRRWELDVLLAGPPCQPFSKSALWSKGSTDRLEDPRAATFDALLGMLEGILPRAFVLENVKGLAYKDDVTKKIRGCLETINQRYKTHYQVTMVCLNALHYGVAQKRERNFIVCFREGLEFSLPPRTHADPWNQALIGSASYRTSWDAIGDLSSVKPDDELNVQGKWALLLPSIPEGLNYLHHTAKGEGAPLFGWRTRYWSFLLKLAKAQPSWTLQAEPGPATGPFHWNNRQLSIRELCRLQTIPDTYDMCGNYRSARRQVGNAVPPALAEAVAREVRYHLDGSRFIGAASLATRHRPRCPGPEPTGEVPKKFHGLIGDHEAHPGPGRGPRAATRDRNSATQLRSSVPVVVGDGAAESASALLPAVAELGPIASNG